MLLAFERNNLIDAGWEIIAESDEKITVSRLCDVRGHSGECQLVLFVRGDKLICGFPFESFDDSEVAEETRKVFADSGTTYEVL